jgi:glycosyltransferase involved in cell wall biosynthesis
VNQRLDRVVAIVPAYDVAQSLADVLERLHATLPDARSIVVDDGSRDRTASVAREAGAHVIRHARNRGKGASLRTGIEAALAESPDVLLLLDGDGQHPPEVAPSLIAATNDADFVIGARARRRTPMPLQRRISNELSSRVVSRLARRPISDSQSGYRAIRADVMRAIRPRGNRYDLETDLLVRAARAGFRIAEVPIPTVYDSAASHFRPLRDTALLVRTMLRLQFASSR